jgi:hypothetical protein
MAQCCGGGLALTASQCNIEQSLTKRYLGPSPGSAASERLFNSAGDICTDSRDRLFADIAEMRIVLEVNMSLNNSTSSKTDKKLSKSLDGPPFASSTNILQLAIG